MAFGEALFATALLEGLGPGEAVGLGVDGDFAVVLDQGGGFLGGWLPLPPAGADTACGSR
jgi:hypothetical protein